MNLPDILEIDLPTIIVLVVLWLLDYFKIRKIDKTVDEMKARR